MCSPTVSFLLSSLSESFEHITASERPTKTRKPTRKGRDIFFPPREAEAHLDIEGIAKGFGFQSDQ